MSIPALFRRVLEAGDPDYVEGRRPQLVIVYGEADQEYLEGYTVDEADRLEEKIDRLPSSALKRRLTRQILSRSLATEIDPDGRLVLPIKQREKIGLTKEAVFVGTSGTFQIWSPERYEAHLAEEDEALDADIPEGTDPLDALDMVLARMGEE